MADRTSPRYQRNTQPEELDLPLPLDPTLSPIQPTKAFSTGCYPESYVYENTPHGPPMSLAHTADGRSQTHPGVVPSTLPPEVINPHPPMRPIYPNVVDLLLMLAQYYSMPFPVINTIANDNPLLAYYHHEIMTNMGNMADLCTLVAAMSASSLHDTPEHTVNNGSLTPELSSPFQGISAFNEDTGGPYKGGTLPGGSPLQEVPVGVFEGTVLPGPPTPVAAGPQDGDEIPVDGARNLGGNLLAWFTCDGRVGIRLSLALQGALSALDDGEDISIFRNAEFATKVYYRIFWPGYQSFEHGQYAKSKKKGYITRVKIVQHVATITAKFIEHNKNFMSTDDKWRVGPNGIQLENLELIGLKRHLKAGVVPVFRYRHSLVGPQA